MRRRPQVGFSRAMRRMRGEARRRASGGRAGSAWTSSASRAASLGDATRAPSPAARSRDWIASPPRPGTARPRGAGPAAPGGVGDRSAGGPGVDGGARGSRGQWPPTRRARRGETSRHRPRATLGPLGIRHGIRTETLPDQRWRRRGKFSRDTQIEFLTGTAGLADRSPGRAPGDERTPELQAR